MTGLAQWRAACQAHGVVESPPPPPAELPATFFGSPLDPTLAAFYRHQNGGCWSSDTVLLRIHPLDGPDALAPRNAALRRRMDDFDPPYPFNDVLVYAQFGRQASYLACLPSIADAAGRQPVLFLDLHEDVWAIPIAPCVDAAFRVLADWLAAPLDPAFPLETPDLLQRDAAFAAAVRSGRFASWTGQNPEILAWIAACYSVSKSG